MSRRTERVMRFGAIVPLLVYGVFAAAFPVASACGQSARVHASPPLRTVAPLDGGGVAGIGPGGFGVSHDGGRTWGPFAMPPGFGRGEVRGLQRINTNRLVLVAEESASPRGSNLTIAGSRDGGRIWSAPQVIASRGVLECFCATSAGLIVVTADRPTVEGTELHVQVSREGGVGWASMGSIRLPAGVRKPGSRSRYGTAISDQAGGILRVLTTTDAGCLWEASLRPGRDRWTGIMPAPVAAGPAPIAMQRLASGRLALAGSRPASFGRPSRWLALSHNDGVTWTVPGGLPEWDGATGAAVAGALGLGEIKPGVLWLADELTCLEVKEADYLQTPGAARSRRSIRVLMMGDSITRGARPGVTFTAVYSELVRESLRGSALGIEVHNVGIGAERTDQALARLERDVLSQAPAVVTLMYGTNDSYVDAGRSASRLTRTEYRQNLETLVARIRESGAAPILMTPPRWGAAAKPNGAGENPNLALTGYVEECRSVARRLDVPIVDHYRRWSESEKSGVDVGGWTTDQCHPNAEGHERLAAELLPVLRRVLARVQPSQQQTNVR